MAIGARAISVAAFILTLGGIGLLARGVYDADPILFWGTESELASAREGRHFVLVATLELVLAGGLFARRGKWAMGVLVATPGVVCAAIVYSTAVGQGPPAAFLLFLPLALSGFVGALVALLEELRRPSAWITVTLALMPWVMGLALIYGFDVAGRFPVALYLVLPLASLALAVALLAVVSGSALPWRRS